MQSGMQATPNADQKMSVMINVLMKSSFDRIDELVTTIQAFKTLVATIIEQSVWTTVTANGSANRRNISGLMEMIKKVIHGKLEGTSEEEDMDAIASRLRAL